MGAKKIRPFVSRIAWLSIRKVVLPSACLILSLLLFFRVLEEPTHPMDWARVALLLAPTSVLPVFLISLVNGFATGEGWSFSSDREPKFNPLTLLAGRVLFLTQLWLYYIFFNGYRQHEGGFASLEGVVYSVMLALPVFLSFICFFSGSSIFNESYEDDSRQAKTKRFFLWLILELPEQIINGLVLLMGLASSLYLIVGLIAGSVFNIDILNYQYSGVLILPGIHFLYHLAMNAPSIWLNDQAREERREEWVEKSKPERRANS